jgi:type IV pilus assembly protein PilM
MALLAKKEDTFGIDIGTTGVRVVQLASHGGKPALVSYAKAALDPGLAQSDAPLDQDKVARAVADLVKTAGISTKQVVAGLSSADAFATVITTPKLSDAELAKAMKVQADQYIPMAVDQVKMDWHVLGQGKTAEEMRVLLVAAPNTAIMKLLNIIEKAGLELQSLEINALALVRSMMPPTGLSALLLDVGNTGSEITIVHQSAPYVIRAVPVGRQTLVRAVAQTLGLDDVQADQFAVKFGLTQTKLEGQVAKAMKPSLDNLMAEVDKSIKFFMNENPGTKLEKVVLTGSAASLPEFPTYVANATGLPVEIGNPWSNIAYPAAQQQALMNEVLDYGVAAGLALRNLI